MNILILSGRFGMGHIKAAAAIEEKVRARVPRRKPCSFKEFLPKVSRSAVFRFCLLFARAVKRKLKFRVRTPQKNDSC